MIMVPELDLALLRTFVAVVEAGGLTAAGRRVGRTQPAITHQLRRLEEALGRPVFDADRRRLKLTGDGEVLLDHARNLLRLGDEVLAHFSEPAVEGHVKLGVPDLYAAYLLPEILGSFSRAYPRIEIDLQCRRSVHLHEALEQREIDLALVTRQPGFDDGETVRVEPLVWVTGAVGRLELEETLPLAVLPAGSVYRQSALEALGAARRRWRITSVGDSIAGLQAAIFAGLAIAVFPDCAVAPGMRRLGPSEGLPALPALDLVLHRQPRITEAAAHLAGYLAPRLRHVVGFQPWRAGRHAR